MTVEAENYYEILGVRPGVDDEQVKLAYRELAKNYHPDRNPGDPEAERRFKLVGTAYEALKDSNRRQTYDEYIRFNEGQKKTRQRQWSRLAALIALLLFGPTLVFFSVYAFTGANVLSSFSERPNGTQPAPTLDVALEDEPDGEPVRQSDESVAAAPAEDIAEAAGEPAQGDNGAITQDESLKPNVAALDETSPEEPTAITEPGASAASPAAETPGSTETALDENTAPSSEAGTGATRTAEASRESASEQAELDAAQSESPPLTEASDDSDTTPEVEYTNAIPDASAAETEDAEGLAPDEADSPEEPAARIALPDRRPDIELSTLSAGESARASARRLAELKEPSGDGGGQEQQVASLPPAVAAPRTFSDCRVCPLMSLAPPSERSGGAETIAISRSEITRAQWNVCVEDGVCAPHGEASGGGPASPVNGLRPETANAYAEWLSMITGRTYRVLMPSGPTEMQRASDEDCAVSDEWQWLADTPEQRNCVSENAPGGGPSGFRVARQAPNQG